MSDRGGWDSALGLFDNPAPQLQSMFYDRGGQPIRAKVDEALASLELPFELSKPPRPRDGEVPLETVARVFGWQDVTAGIDGAKAAIKAAKAARDYVHAIHDQRQRLIDAYQGKVMDAIAAGASEMPRPSDKDLAESARLRETAAMLTRGRRSSQLVDVYAPPARFAVPEAAGLRVIRDREPQRVVLAAGYGVALSRVLREAKSADAQRARDMGEGLVRWLLEWARAEWKLASQKPPNHGSKWPENRRRQAEADKADAIWEEQHRARVLQGVDPLALLLALHAMSVAARIPVEIDELQALPA